MLTCFFFFVCYCTQTYAQSNSKWTFYPASFHNESLRYGIVMGGSANMFSSERMSTQYSVCLAHLYARVHSYAFHVEMDLSSYSNRSYGNCSAANMTAWNKIPFIQEYIKDVDVILWVDLDAFISDDSFQHTLDKFLPPYISSQSSCLGLPDGILSRRSKPQFYSIRESTVELQSRLLRLKDDGWMLGKVLYTLGKSIRHNAMPDMPGALNQPFLWVSQDINPDYSVNINTGVMGIRNGRRSEEFLRDVWKVGNDPEYFKKFDSSWFLKTPCEGYWGWPWEQGGVWSVLSEVSKREYLRGTCIRPRKGRFALNSVRGNPMLKAISSIGTDSHDDIVFAFHHSKVPPRYILKRLIMRGVVTSDDIKKYCGLSIHALRLSGAKIPSLRVSRHIDR